MTIKNEQAICVIGPTSPYRGGISQYTDSLVGALKNKTERVEVFSFSRQYPAFLYPGESDRKPDGTYQEGVHYTLDSNNPLTWRKTAHEIRRLKPEIVYISWWTIFWQPAFAYISRQLKKQGIKVVYICHNVYDHDASPLKKTITKKLITYADGYLVHSQEQASLLRSITKDKAILVRQHPVYDTFPKPKASRAKDKKLKLLFIGLIRPYKGLDVLLDAYRMLGQKEREQIKLSVVGEFWGDKAELVKDLESLQIKHDLRFVTDQEMVDYIASHDAVVLPYKTATGSGIIPVAYHCLRPVIATKVGGLGEVVSDKKTGWLVSPDSPNELAAVMKQVTPDMCAAMADNIAGWVRDNSWEAMAEALQANFAK